MNGILIVNKPKGYTSRDVVNKVGKILGTKKIGHTGTLDPMATGILVLCVGKALKLVELLTNHDKEYVFGIKLGIETDTLDVTGNIIKRGNVPNLSKEDIIRVLNQFIGSIKQEVPIYSSIKVNGKKLYEYARNGEDVVLPVRDICIYSIDFLDMKDDEIFLRSYVSKGTYIRSLARDIARALGTFGTVSYLDRVRLGDFTSSMAYSIEDIEKGNFSLLDVVDVIDLPKVKVDSFLEKKIRNGQVMKKFFDDDMVFILNNKGDLLAIYQNDGNGYVRPYRMFL